MYTWLIVAGILLIAELLTGTFYLLMLAIAGVIAWFAMLLNFDFLAQSIVFLISASILVLFTQRLRARLNANTKPNLADNLDAGEIITVTDWVDGSVSVTIAVANGLLYSMYQTRRLCPTALIASLN